MKNYRLFLFTLMFLLLYAACKKKSTGTEPEEGKESIVILYTNDEHGWMEKCDYTDGGAAMMGLWQEQEEYIADGPYLILSGGDNWTGPAISTWFKGESMVAVMNAMGYTASAIGNHEFDFKIDGLKDRIAQAEFSYISANIREKATGQIPDYIIPYIIKDVKGVKIGIIGLSSITTPWSAYPDYVKDLDFIAYDTALEQIVPQVKSEGAELLVVLGHICRDERLSLVNTAKSLGISIIAGGHCHHLVSEEVDGIILIEGGSDMLSYGRVDIIFDDENDEIIEMSHGIYYNKGGNADPLVDQVVSYWQSQKDAALSAVIGYAGQEIGQYSPAMHNMVTDSWLYKYPTADISMTTSGGIRQSIPTGDITLATMVGLQPFENSIIELELTGTQVIDCVGELVVGGMTTINGYYHSDGTPLVADSVYNVLTIDYLYSLSNSKFSLYDPTPYSTSVNYRQPVIDWIESLQTSSSDPLNNYLDHVPR